VPVHIDIFVVIPEQCVEQARPWTVKVLSLACGCFWVYSTTNFTTGRKIGGTFVPSDSHDIWCNSAEGN